MIKMLQTTA